MHNNREIPLVSCQRPREACGITAVFSPNETAMQTAFYSLFALQHRGQESAGIATADGAYIHIKKGMGLIAQVFDDSDASLLPGFAAIAHTRYSTSGASKDYNSQPYLVDIGDDPLALAHNGNLINSVEIHDWIAESNPQAAARARSDSELIALLYSMAPGKTWAEKSAFCMRKLKGAYSLVLLTRNSIVGIRDPLGIRPLCYGKINGGWVIASESAALDNVGATQIRDLQHGETLVINNEGVKSSIWQGARQQQSLCIFEHIYFARPDSVLNGELSYAARIRMGMRLYQEHPVEADMVMGVPDSAVASAVGFAQAAQIPYGEGLVRNRYAGRTFIEPDQRLREVGVRKKFNAMSHIINGKRLIVVDDSIVRGTTTPRVIHLLREAGAKEIHMRISSPPIISTCHFGVDLAMRADLIAANESVDGVCRIIGADSLGYLSLQGLWDSVRAGKNGAGFCHGCFSGRYPMEVQLDMDKMELETQRRGAKSNVDLPPGNTGNKRTLTHT